MPSNQAMIRKLQHALNTRGLRITYSTSQFYSADQDRPVTIYNVKQAIWDSEKEKYVNRELFKATSQIQIVLFLRDLWYTVNGKEVPQDNEVWNNIKSSQKGDY